MITKRIASLYELVPGFEHDRDERWYKYLEPADLNSLRAQRNEFLILLDQQDQLKLELKQHPKGSKAHNETKAMLLTARKDTNAYVDNLLLKIPLLKNKASKAEREQTQHSLNLGAGSSKRRRTALDMDDEEDILTSHINKFLPSTLRPQPPPVTAAPRPSQPPAQAPQGSQSPSVVKNTATRPARDTYLDGVHEQEVAIMKRMRTMADKFDCRTKILDALKRIHVRDQYLEAMDQLKKMAAALEPKNAVALR